MNRLVVNGCSYMSMYDLGDGHTDLAKKLNIATAESLAIAGASNSRIIRTTLKDSYTTKDKTFYLIGLSFLNREEFPINADMDTFEGRWLSTQHINIQNYYYSVDKKCLPTWTSEDSKIIIELKNKIEIDSIEDRLEHLMYQLLSMINDLISRGHQVLVFRQPEDSYANCLDTAQFAQLKNCKNIVNGLSWAAVPWQIDNGARFNQTLLNPAPGTEPIIPGEHELLNDFLYDYILKNHILEG